MYLGDCRRNNPGTGRWFFQDGRVAGSRDMDRQLDLVDDTLNSWEEAHNAFDRHQGDEPVITNAAFMQMRSLVHQAAQVAVRPWGQHRDRLADRVDHLGLVDPLDQGSPSPT